MRHLRTATLATLTFLTLGGGLVWSAHGGTEAPKRETGIEAASGDSPTPNIPERAAVNTLASNMASIEPTYNSNPVNTSIPAAATATTGQQPKSTTKPDGTTPSTAPGKATSTTKRPGKQPPATKTVDTPNTGDPNRIIENGYVNLDGVRVSAVNTANNGREIYEKCGRIGEQTVKLWFKYADGVIRDERWIVNGKQVNVFRTDGYGNPAWRPVFMEASGLDPYGDVWTEENGYEPTEWIWCANRAPINQ